MSSGRCVYPVAVLNGAFCITCSLLMLVEVARGDHMEGRGILQSRSHDCLVCIHECLLLFTPFIICSGVCACTKML